jgi:hypothetical protein
MYTSTQREKPAGISSGSIDALRVQLMKMNSQQLQAFATANQDDAIKLGLVAEADKYKKQHGQEALALMSGQQAQPPVAQQILQGIGQPPQQPMPPQGQGMPPQQMAQGQMPPQGMANGGYMLPEDQGIGTLPAQNMQNFAGGGIVAFEEGGDVPRFQSGVFLGGVTEYGGLSPLDFKTPKTDAQLLAERSERKQAAQAIINESPEAYAARKVAELEALGAKKGAPPLTPDARNMAMSQFVKDKIAGQVKRGEASFTSSGQLPAPANVYTGTALPGCFTLTVPSCPTVTPRESGGIVIPGASRKPSAVTICPF